MSHTSAKNLVNFWILERIAALEQGPISDSRMTIFTMCTATHCIK